MKVLLIPLGIVAFVLFLLVLGAIGLAVALGTIWLLGRVGRLLATVGRFLTGRGRRQRRARAATEQG